MPNPHKTYSLEESGAFMEVLEIEPYASGPLDGLRFAVKDVIDLGGHVTGCGNPDWARTHPGGRGQRRRASTSCSWPGPAASARPSATNWPSAWTGRIFSTAPP